MWHRRPARDLSPDSEVTGIVLVLVLVLDL